jgi:hypothetical protein
MLPSLRRGIINERFDLKVFARKTAYDESSGDRLQALLEVAL